MKNNQEDKAESKSKGMLVNIYKDKIKMAIEVVVTAVVVMIALEVVVAEKVVWMVEAWAVVVMEII